MIVCTTNFFMLDMNTKLWLFGPCWIWWVTFKDQMLRYTLFVTTAGHLLALRT